MSTIRERVCDVGECSPFALMNRAWTASKRVAEKERKKKGGEEKGKTHLQKGKKKERGA